MKPKHLPKRLIVTIFFFALLVFSTDLMLAIPRQDVFRLKRVDESQYSPFVKNFPYEIASFSQNQDVFYTVEFSGWAYLHTNQYIENKQIKLLFESTKNTYIVDTHLQQIYNKKLLEADRAYGLQHGFITSFSPVKMADGVYLLHIYCYENEDSVGFQDTGQQYQKTGRDFVELVNAGGVE